MIPVEIERKFLVKCLPVLGVGTPIRQGYLTKKGATVRVRVAGAEAWITVKGRAVGMTKPEFEYPIPVEHAEYMLENMCDDRIIEKTRYFIPIGEHTLELDVFGGNLEGLVIAEVEVSAEDDEIDLPGWVGREVTEDKQYKNKKLASRQKVPEDSYLYEE